MVEHCVPVHGNSCCRVCEKIPIVISLRGDLVASSYPDFKRAVALACEMRPCRRLTFDLQSAHNIEALAGMFVMELITPHRELRLVLANIPMGLKSSLSPVEKALRRWIEVSAHPIQLRGIHQVFHRVASFKGHERHAAWKYGVYCADLH
ncbi:MAG: hypothetical protein J0L75_16420 [Spirochaetes bacterium]|nr:hypothetical protein [Spirochaetota bacterium]